MKQEQWKDVPGYEGRYRLSSLGRVEGPEFTEKKSGAIYYMGSIIQNDIDNVPKLQLWMTKDGERTSCQMDKMMARLFVPNPDNLPNVLHRNHIAGDNRAVNLYWTTYKSEYAEEMETLDKRKPKTKTYYTDMSTIVTDCFIDVDKPFYVNSELLHIDYNNDTDEDIGYVYYTGNFIPVTRTKALELIAKLDEMQIRTYHIHADNEFGDYVCQHWIYLQKIRHDVKSV